MKLLKLEVEGLRSLKRIHWSPQDLNLVIGANGSGKTNLIMALHYLTQAACGQLGEAISQAGGIRSQVWDGEQEIVRFLIKTSPIDKERDVVRDSLTYILELKRAEIGHSYRVHGELLGNFYRVETGERTEPLKLLERNAHHAVVFDEQQRALVPQDYIAESESLLSYATGPFGANRLIAAYQKVICNWLILKDFQAHSGAEVRQPAISTPTTKLASDGRNLVSVIHTFYTNHREFKSAFDSALFKVFGEKYREIVFAPHGDRYIDLRVRWKSLKREQPIAELSAGVLRFMLVTTALNAPIDIPLIAIDEPDLGLHPHMLPVLADMVRQRQKKSQVILTSATSGLLDSFEKTPPTAIAQWDGAETQIQPLSGDALEDWVAEFSDLSQVGGGSLPSHDKGQTQSKASLNGQHNGLGNGAGLGHSDRNGATPKAPSTNRIK